MNDQLKNFREKKLNFYEYYYDQSGRLSYDQEEINKTPESELKKEFPLVLRNDLKNRYDHIDDMSVSTKLNYDYQAHTVFYPTESGNKKTDADNGELNHEGEEGDKVIRDDRKYNQYWYVRNSAGQTYSRWGLFLLVFPIGLLLVAINYFMLEEIGSYNFNVSQSLLSSVGLSSDAAKTAVKGSIIGVLLFLLGFGSIYLSVKRFNFKDRLEFVNDYSSFRALMKFIMLFMLFTVSVASYILYVNLKSNIQSINGLKYTMIYGSISLAGVFLISSLIFILVQFFYRKKFVDIEFKPGSLKKQKD